MSGPVRGSLHVAAGQFALFARDLEDYRRDLSAGSDLLSTPLSPSWLPESRELWAAQRSGWSRGLTALTIWDRTVHFFALAADTFGRTYTDFEQANAEAILGVFKGVPRVPQAQIGHIDQKFLNGPDVWYQRELEVGLPNEADKLLATALDDQPVAPEGESTWTWPVWATFGELYGAAQTEFAADRRPIDEASADWQVMATLFDNIDGQVEQSLRRLATWSGDAAALFKDFFHREAEGATQVGTLAQANSRCLEALLPVIDQTHSTMQVWFRRYEGALGWDANGRVWGLFGYSPDAATVKEWQDETKEDYREKAVPVVQNLAGNFANARIILDKVSRLPWGGRQADPNVALPG